MVELTRGAKFQELWIVNIACASVVLIETVLTFPFQNTSGYVAAIWYVTLYREFSCCVIRSFINLDCCWRYTGSPFDLADFFSFLIFRHLNESVIIVIVLGSCLWLSVIILTKNQKNQIQFWYLCFYPWMRTRVAPSVQHICGTFHYSSLIMCDPTESAREGMCFPPPLTASEANILSCASISECQCERISWWIWSYKIHGPLCARKVAIRALLKGGLCGVHELCGNATAHPGLRAFLTKEMFSHDNLRKEAALLRNEVYAIPVSL